MFGGLCLISIHKCKVLKYLYDLCHTWSCIEYAGLLNILSPEAENESIAQSKYSFHYVHGATVWVGLYHELVFKEAPRTSDY